MSCAVCQKRRAKRFCAALGEKICAICCGEGREVTVDCALDCTYLITAHRYEAEHRKPITADQLPYRDLLIPTDFIYQRWPVISGLATSILAFHAQTKELNDVDACSAIEASAETYRTLGTGIYYEQPPNGHAARALYAHLDQFVKNFRQDPPAQTKVPALKDSDIFRLFVFLLRVGKQEMNGRPRSRAFLGFLRSRFPLPAEAARESSRIIIP